jgi:GT2 family glycosyltransferase
MYRRDALEKIGGFDERYAAYDSCDLNLRMKELVGGEVVFARGAVVLHKHRDSWKEYWRQQVNYGRGLAQFYARWDSRIQWSLSREVAEWVGLIPKAVASCLPGRDDLILARRGDLVKRLAQRIGFVTTYFSGAERSRWTSSG